MTRYVDVFISHKMEDAEKAKELKRRVEGFGVSCWIDDDDAEMKRIQTSVPVDYSALTDRIRENLRTCRSLIYAYSARSRGSRWMPWELGFFDGRWGRRLIGLYDLDEGIVMEAEPAGEAAGIPEFLEIYTELRPATLEDFLQYVRSPRALSDRADVDVDRWANLAAGMMRDPVNVSIDAMQFWISYHQAFLGRTFGTSAPDLGRPMLALTEIVRATMAPFAKMMQPAAQDAFDGWLQPPADATNEAQKLSRGGVPPAFAVALQPPAADIDRFVRLVHEVNVDALKASR